MDWLHPKPAAPVISLDSAQAQVTSSDAQLKAPSMQRTSSLEPTPPLAEESGSTEENKDDGSADGLVQRSQSAIDENTKNFASDHAGEESKPEMNSQLADDDAEHVSPSSSPRNTPSEPKTSYIDLKNDNSIENVQHESLEERSRESDLIPEVNAQETDKNEQGNGALNSANAQDSKTDTPSKDDSKLDMAKLDAATHDGQLRRSSIAEMQRLGEPQSTASMDAPFDFQQFLSLMRSRRADPVARYIRSFLQEFCKQAWTPNQQEKIVADFMRFITVKMRSFEPFSSLDKAELRNVHEGIEKLVMNRLYVRTFPPKMAPILRREGHDDELLRDHVVSQRLRLWKWVEGRHLDINEEYLVPSFLDLACKELRRIHQFRAPRDKMICILNCSKVVWALIRQAHLEQNADSFLPLLIYVVLQAQPPHIVSNINYIQRFRSKKFREGETAYYLSTLASSVAFIEGLEKSSLTISDAEFEAKMSEACVQEGKANTMLPGESSSPSSRGTNTPPSSVIAQSAGIMVDRVKRMFEDLSVPENPDTGVPSGSEGEVSPEEVAAMQSSRDEYQTQQNREKEFTVVSNTLQQMFPVLDREVIQDVLHQKGTSIGQAVDTCLALVGD